ncbi:GNAT family N-acetyltransferase [Roseobacter weihaiensis]|uniref:GNAT family N-acetyltransferase n=1 Tax=Roseobacter weihaiensis TaxID=2763262 RepID=UPI001D0AE951|nr:GNAT family N-acetyltransferase [Roseobacter sp. H9]
MIRAFAFQDTEAIVSIWRLASQTSHPFLSGAYLDSLQNVIRKRFIDLAETWVWQDEDLPVGFVSVLQGEIAGLYVLPEHQSRGIGRALLSHVLSSLGTVKLDVFARNRAGHAFYRKIGFFEIGRRFDDTSGHEVIRMCYAP